MHEAIVYQSSSSSSSNNNSNSSNSNKLGVPPYLLSRMKRLREESHESNNRNFPVTRSNTSFSHGPTAMTVSVPYATSVLPASSTTKYGIRFMLKLARKSSNVSVFAMDKHTFF